MQTPPQTKAKGSLQDLLAFAPYLRPHIGRLVLSLVLVLVGALGAMYFPYASRIAIDRYIIPHKTAGLASFVLFTGLVVLLTAIANSWRIRLMAEVGQHSVRQIRLDLFRHLQHLPVAYFDTMPVGKVMTRLTSDVDALAELLGGALVRMLGDLLTVLGFAVIMLLIDWRLALVTMAGLPLMIYAFTFLRSQIRKAEDVVRESASTVNAILQENVSGMRVIQAFCADTQFMGRFEQVNQELLRAALHSIFVFGFFWPIVDFTWVAGTGVLVLFGGLWALQGTLTIGTFVAFNLYSSQFFGPLQGLSQVFRIIQRALAGAVRIRELLQMAAEGGADTASAPVLAGRVDFHEVTFGYNPAQPVLKGISFTAQPGRLVAIVGHSGAGKTSLINLLCRFYTPQAGKITADGIDINSMHLEAYRKQIALVLQDPYLFSGTIRDNLRYGCPTATDEQMNQALAAAGLTSSFAMQGITLDTALHERGENLSAGQRQLLSFARAILVNPRIIILDEATAHVDTITERWVQSAMVRLLAGRTAFVIAHRLSTIQAADLILVIEEGCIAERGTHSELLAARGRYWRLCQEQSAWTTGTQAEQASTNLCNDSNLCSER